MKFFIPLAEDEEQEKRVYRSIIEYLRTESGAVVSERRVFSLSYRHKGTDYYAEVGKNEQPNGELVIAIIFDESRNLYLVCTPNRGVARGGPILVGAHDVLSVIDFDD